MVTGEESLLLMCLVAFAHGEYWSFLSKTTIKNPCQNQVRLYTFTPRFLLNCTGVVTCVYSLQLHYTNYTR